MALDLPQSRGGSPLRRKGRWRPRQTAGTSRSSPWPTTSSCTDLHPLVRHSRWRRRPQIRLRASPADRRRRRAAARPAGCRRPRPRSAVLMWIWPTLGARERGRLLLLRPRLLADTGEWGTFAWAEHVLNARLPHCRRLGRDPAQHHRRRAMLRTAAPSAAPSTRTSVLGGAGAWSRSADLRSPLASPTSSDRPQRTTSHARSTGPARLRADRAARRAAGRDAGAAPAR